LPYTLLHQILSGQHRTPARLATAVTIGLAAFIALSLQTWLRSVAPKGQRNSEAIRILALTIIMLGCSFDFGFLRPFPTFSPKDYFFYRTIGADKTESTLIEVPLAPYSGFAGFGIENATSLEYYAQFHHKRIVNGTLSRLPTNALDRYQVQPLLRAFAGQGPLPPFPQASADLATRVERWNIRYIVLHRDYFDEPTARHLMQFLNAQPSLCLMAEEYDALAYRVIPWAECPTKEQLAPGDGRIELGQPSSERFVGPGWYWAENVGGPQARWAGESLTSTLRVWLPSGATRVHFRALAYPAHQRVSVVVNGQALADIALAQDWADYAFDIPSGVIGQAPVQIELRHTALEAPVPLGGSAADRSLAAAYQWFEFTSAR
jgi:hypothetical protein